MVERVAEVEETAGAEEGIGAKGVAEEVADIEVAVSPVDFDKVARFFRLSLSCWFFDFTLGCDPVLLSLLSDDFGAPALTVVTASFFLLEVAGADKLLATTLPAPAPAPAAAARLCLLFLLFPVGVEDVEVVVVVVTDEVAGVEVAAETEALLSCCRLFFFVDDEEGVATEVLEEEDDAEEEEEEESLVVVVEEGEAVVDAGAVIGVGTLRFFSLFLLPVVEEVLDKADVVLGGEEEEEEELTELDAGTGEGTLRLLFFFLLLGAAEVVEAEEEVAVVVRVGVVTEEGSKVATLFVFCCFLSFFFFFELANGAEEEEAEIAAVVVVDFTEEADEEGSRVIGVGALFRKEAKIFFKLSSSSVTFRSALVDTFLLLLLCFFLFTDSSEIAEEEAVVRVEVEI